MPAIPGFCISYDPTRRCPTLRIQSSLRLKVTVGRGDDDIDVLGFTSINEAVAQLCHLGLQIFDLAAANHVRVP